MKLWPFYLRDTASHLWRLHVLKVELKSNKVHRQGLIILPKNLKHNRKGAGPINYDNDDDNDDDDDGDDDDDNDDNDDYDVFSSHQRTSNTIGTMGGWGDKL